MCAFCKDTGQHTDYKNTGLLRKYLTDRGKIQARRRITGNCRQHQRDLAVAVKISREIALLASPRPRPATRRTGSDAVS